MRHAGHDTIDSHDPDESLARDFLLPLVADTRDRTDAVRPRPSVGVRRTIGILNGRCLGRPKTRNAFQLFR